ncbi:MAG: TRAP transporter substrate-binding protein DctP [Alphaproteobacteria bacterium]|nr:TRAP transporter substrate-binding protein DctP [Deltaproteobacteria bacterium]MCB9690208.1 TRAP transporter substrate-binding protein DctP [Alphaproteobacteria bacterium]
MSARTSLGVLLALALPATALATDKPLVIKVGTVAPKGTPWSVSFDAMAQDVEAAAGAKGVGVDFEMYFGGSLGGEKEMVRETREGRLHLFGGSVSSLATIVPELYIFETPFLFESDEEADYVLDQVRPQVAALLAERGFVLYHWSENGWQGIALDGGCVTSMKSLAGKKLRSQEAKVHLDTFEALGASPVAIAVPEVLPALKQGVVDGFANTVLFAFATGWYTGIDSFTETNHIYQPSAVVYSKKWFDGLPEATRALLLMDPLRFEANGRKRIRGIRAGLVANLEKAKKQVCPLDPKLRAEMKTATKPVFDKYVAGVGDGGRPLVQAVLAAKKAWARR